MVLIIFLISSIFHLTQCSTFTQISEYRKQCMEELKLDIDNPKVFRNFNFLTNAQISDIQCLERCILIKRGIINENETVQEDKLKESYPSNINITIDVSQSCPVIQNLTDKCEKAYLIGKCIQFQIHRELNRQNHNRPRFKNKPPPEWREYKTECFREVNESDSNLTNSIGPNADNNARFHRELCIQRCIMIKMGIINANNTIQENKFRELLGNNQNLNITQCTIIKNDDKCKEAMDIKRCLNRTPFLHI
ncbi:hypothetical protein Trydic_g23242 [Trypoxylus dichotomus]